MIKEHKLLPCPFCGKPPVLHRSNFKTIVLHKCEYIEAKIGWGKTQEVVEKWNTRTPIVQQSLSGSDSKESTPKSSAWYCEECKQRVDGSNVTFEETHDGCGGKCR
jgi:ribosomal protein L37AE/L43A